METILTEEDIEEMEKQPFLVANGGLAGSMEGKYDRDYYESIDELIESLLARNLKECNDDRWFTIVVCDFSDIRDGVIHSYEASGDVEEVIFSEEYPTAGSTLVPRLTEFSKKDLTDGFEFADIVGCWKGF